MNIDESIEKILDEIVTDLNILKEMLDDETYGIVRNIISDEL